jgi:arginine N-succinyltransferase
VAQLYMKNLLFRHAKDTDLDAIHALTKESGFGLTTLPKDRALLRARLAHATASWQAISPPPDNAYYLFVLEDCATGALIGTSAIDAQIGQTSPFYAYKLSKRKKTLHEVALLNLVNDHQGHTELCTLYLAPAYRKDACGAFLSRARFLFMSQYPALFSETIIAEMRGITTTDGHSPFWDALGYHFFHISFLEADKLTLSTDKQFIADSMPEHPIYINLLSKAAQSVIGKAHPSTVPAMQLLIREGFYYNNYVDIFDAGPLLESPLSHIKTVQLSDTYTFESTQDTMSPHVYMLSNTKPNFRATKAHALLNIEKKTCILTPETSTILNLKPGDSVRIAPF